MNEDFQTLFLTSLRDGSYNLGLDEKISSICTSVHHIQESDRDGGGDNSQSGWDNTAENAAEIANNIVYDSNLSQSHGNPDYYPPIPGTNKHSNLKDTESTVRKNTFVEDGNVIVTTSPITYKDMDLEFAGLGAIDPNMLSRTHIEEVDINIITGFIPSPSFQCPIIKSCVSHIVGIYVDPKTDKKHLSHILVYNKRESIMSLLDYLISLRVENMEDLTHAREHIKTIPV